MRVLFSSPAALIRSVAALGRVLAASVALQLIASTVSAHPGHSIETLPVDGVNHFLVSPNHWIAIAFVGMIAVVATMLIKQVLGMHSEAPETAKAFASSESRPAKQRGE